MALLLALTACGHGGHAPEPALSAQQGGDERVSALLQAHFSEWRGTPHRWGGQDRRGIDCSGFVSLTYERLFGIRLPRTTRAQARAGERVERGELRPGDLVFFKTGWRARHVGIYLGRGRFIHAAESSGVTTTHLDAPYWGERFWQARRLP